MPPSNPATRFQAAAISFSLINLVSRPLYHHWPLLAYLSPRTSHSFRVFFALSIFPFFLSLAINSICLKYLARSRIHSIEVFTIEEEIEFRIYSFLLSLFIPCPDGMDYAFAWSHYLVHQWSPHHPSIQKENSFSKQWNFVSIPGLSRYRCFAGNPACVASVKRRMYIYIYVCIILDTFRWCFNFPINACLNRASRDLANLYFTRFARIKFYSFYITFDVCLFPI